MADTTTPHAAIDLGSNSFHMLVAQHDGHQLRVVDRLKEMVRLAGGIDRHGRLDPVVRERAVACLARFGQRISVIPDLQVRAVGTQSFRRLAHPAAFLVVAETALGCPIDIISGREEARLVYKGVLQGVPTGDDRSLIVDIGGGSTELVIGRDEEPELTESLPLGCVSLTREGFPDGRLTPKRWRRAVEGAQDQLVEIVQPCRKLGWQQVIGSSGTLRAVAAMAAGDQETGRGFTRADLDRLGNDVIAAGHVDRIDMPGLSARRRPVIVGGLAILTAIAETLGIDRFEVSPYALREGLLHDLTGRIEHTDPRPASVAGMAQRYDSEDAQAARVHDWAQAAFDQVADAWGLGDAHRDLLLWACQMHEIGRAVSHERHQAHGAYLVSNADMPGFTRPEQRFMAALIALQRGGIKSEVIDWVPQRMTRSLTRLAAVLRLAVTLARLRDDSSMPDFALDAGDERLRLSLPPGWLASNPLSARGLERQQRQLEKLGIELVLDEFSSPGLSA